MFNSGKGRFEDHVKSQVELTVKTASPPAAEASMTAKAGPLSMRTTARKESSRVGGGLTSRRADGMPTAHGGDGSGRAPQQSRSLSSLLSADDGPSVAASNKRWRENLVFGVGNRGRHASVARGQLSAEDTLDNGERPLKNALNLWRDQLTPVRKFRRAGGGYGKEAEAEHTGGGGGGGGGGASRPAEDDEERSLSLAVSRVGVSERAGGGGGGGGGGSAAEDADAAFLRAHVARKAQREHLRRFIAQNADRLWAIEPSLKGKRGGVALDHLMSQCVAVARRGAIVVDGATMSLVRSCLGLTRHSVSRCLTSLTQHRCTEVYGGNFDVMARNLEHDAKELRLHSSVGVQMTIRPPLTFRTPESQHLDSYEVL